jgi:hypothetical protein
MNGVTDERPSSPNETITPTPWSIGDAITRTRPSAKKTAHSDGNDASLEYLFCKQIPIDILFDVFDKICVKKEKYYVMDFNAYRLLLHYNLYPEFANKIVDAYKKHKQYFVTRKLTYNSFATIIRQICRINHVKFDTQFKYQHSMYNIDYYVYHV